MQEKRLRILFVSRFFSGLQRSIAENAWHPSGAPTIYKLIEALRDGGHDLHVIFTARAAGRPDLTRDEIVPLDGFPNPVRILAGEHFFPRGIDKKRALLSEARHAYLGLIEARRLQPDLIYCDRSNVFFARLCARSGSWPVFLRVMGITPGMWRALDTKHPYDLFVSKSYKGRFAHVLCSDDGSGGEKWLSKALLPGTPRSLWLNGVDDPGSRELPDSISSKTANRLIVLFLGRLEELKRSDEFVEAIIRLPNDVAQRIVAVVVGDGDRRRSLQQRVSEAGREDSFIFLGEVPHHDVSAFHQAADIYVSLNSMGNLTNANLEALRAGSCLILPEPEPDSPVDESTRALLGDSVEWIEQTPELAQSLSDAIVRLAQDEGRRKERAVAARRVASDHIPTWDERIAREVALLESLSRSSRS